MRVSIGGDEMAVVTFDEYNLLTIHHGEAVWAGFELRLEVSGETRKGRCHRNGTKINPPNFKKEYSDIVFLALSSLLSFLPDRDDNSIWLKVNYLLSQVNT